MDLPAGTFSGIGNESTAAWSARLNRAPISAGTLPRIDRTPGSVPGWMWEERTYHATLEPQSVPGWKAGDMIASRKAGDAWLKQSKTAVLRVPSVVFDAERNVMINPAHPDFRRFRIVARDPVRWDERLFTETLRS